MVVGGLGLTHEVNAADYTVNNVDELKYYLELPTSDNITVASGVSYLDLGTMKISIQANKVLNLNQLSLCLVSKILESKREFIFAKQKECNC